MAVIEAGLGGRYDATNVIPSRGAGADQRRLEHTRWLGPTIADIAREKLDVVQAGGDARARRRAAPDAVAVARGGGGAERRATIVHAGVDPGVPVGALGRLPAPQLRAARGRPPRPTSARSTRRAVAAAAAEVRVPGRLQIDRRRAADAARRRPQPRRDRGAGRVAARDRRPGTTGSSPSSRSSTTRTPPAMLAALLAALCDALVVTSQSESAGVAAADARSRSPASSAGRRPRSCADPHRALARARELAGPGRRRARHRIDLSRRRPAGAGRRDARASML